MYTTTQIERLVKYNAVLINDIILTSADVPLRKYWDFNKKNIIKLGKCKKFELVYNGE